MRVRLSDPSQAHDLALALVRGDCMVTPAGLDTLTVVHPSARDEEEARTELLFFLRAWQASHPGVSVRLV
jgi:hypothetical protein